MSGKKRERKRWPLLRQLEFIITHLDHKDADLPKPRNAALREIWPRLKYYRAEPDSREALFKSYHAELAKAEAAQSKRDEAARAAKRMETELARQVLDDFMENWDGSDPMAMPAVKG